MPQPIATATTTPSTRAGAGGDRIGRGVERGEQEDRGLEALADDGEERHADERHHRALRERARGVVLERLALSPRACRRIQTTMKVTAPTAISADDRLEALLLRCGSCRLTTLSATPTATQMRDGDRDAGPHPAQRVAAALLAQEGGDDADDQRRLEALAEADHERRQHQFSPRPGNM